MFFRVEESGSLKFYWFQDRGVGTVKIFLGVPCRLCSQVCIYLDITETNCDPLFNFSIDQKIQELSSTGLTIIVNKPCKEGRLDNRVSTLCI